MKLDVIFSPAGLSPAEVAGRPVFVIDVLRTTTTICAALHHGARHVVPVATAEEAMRLAQTLGPHDVVTAGEQRVYHPGDALELPGEDVDVLCVPSSAPWLKASEAIDFARAVGAPRNLAIHDRIYTEAAHGILEQHMRRFLAEGQEYVRIPDGTDLS